MVLCLKAYEVDVGPLDRVGMIGFLVMHGYKRGRRAMCGKRALGGDACREKNHQQKASAHSVFAVGCSCVSWHVQLVCLDRSDFEKGVTSHTPASRTACKQVRKQAVCVGER